MRRQLTHFALKNIFDPRLFYLPLLISRTITKAYNALI